jgi:lysophospholipase L1-like esterase
MSRRWVVVLVLCALVALGCKATAGATTGDNGGGTPPVPVAGFPSSMVALGDSITSGFGSCLAPTACPRNSWSTGDGTQVDSHYRRILKANPAIAGHNRNLAVPGARVSALPGQAAAAVGGPADYVTLLAGANDACSGDMTTAAAFRSSVDQALGTLKKGLPDARLLMVSLPDVFRVWELGHTNSFAVGVWKSGVCPNLLANPTSTASADVARRQAFADRIAAYDGQLRDACHAYGSRCRFVDISGFAFDLNMLSAIDFFHPNASGQNALADQTYPGTFTW